MSAHFVFFGADLAGDPPASLRRHKLRLDVVGTPFNLPALSDSRTQHHHLAHQFFGAVVVAGGFQREQIIVEPGDGIFDLAQVNAEGAVEFATNAPSSRK